MFHCIGDVHVLSREARFFHHLIEQPARRPDERLPPPVFNVARLFADHHYLCPGRSRTKNGLGGVGVKRASLAVLRRLAQRGQIVFLWQKRGCGGSCCGSHGEVRGADPLSVTPLA